MELLKSKSISIMSCSSSYILCIFLFVLLLPYSVLAQGNGIISVGSSITATDKVKSWFSPSGDFAFGFTKVQDQFLLSIWYNKIPDKTIVWFLNDGTTLLLSLLTPKCSSLLTAV